MNKQSWAQAVTRNSVERMITIQLRAAYCVQQMGAHRVAQYYAGVIARDALLDCCTEEIAIKTGIDQGMKLNKLVKIIRTQNRPLKGEPLE